MARGAKKGSREGVAGVEKGTTKGAVGAKRRAKLEVALEAARKAEDKRRRQLDEASALVRSLGKRLAAASPGRADDDAAADAAPSAAEVRAYCLRERTISVMRNPTPTTLRNGRPALAGTCASCGARIVRIGR